MSASHAALGGPAAPRTRAAQGGHAGNAALGVRMSAELAEQSAVLAALAAR
ncbi:hypothetical protein [Streptomyces tateyamensis]|uniref:hypothetical protein n=1 Tax=Streptomyces tateyamensis TaxID=565073 RepID=UPI001C647F52|nr:hypothetical protein [Streptomyces tateyamensis]